MGFAIVWRSAYRPLAFRQMLVFDAWLIVLFFGLSIRGREMKDGERMDTVLDVLSCKS